MLPVAAAAVAVAVAAALIMILHEQHRHLMVSYYTAPRSHMEATCCSSLSVGD